MDASTYTMDGKPRKIIEDKGVGLVELSHKYWVAVLSNTYINGTIPVDAGDRSPDKIITNFCMLSFINSPGNHRAWIVEASARSMIGE